MTSRDARYRTQAGAALRRSERYRTIALDAIAALILRDRGEDWADLLLGPEQPGDLDHAEVRRRVAELRSRMDRRTR